MPTFDAKTFAELSGKGYSPLEALGTTYGVPSCMMNMGADLMSQIPSNVLGGLRSDIENAEDAADGTQKKLASKLRKDTGITEMPTEQGNYRLISNSSQHGSDSEGGMGFLADLTGSIGTAISTGGQLYNNYQTGVTEMEAMQSCLDKYEEFKKFSGGEAATQRAELQALDPSAHSDILGKRYAVAVQQAADATAFLASATAAKGLIDDILYNRFLDPSLEPQSASSVGEIASEEVFRLQFGPPLSTKGKFILSVDGLYFDSQSGGLEPALLELRARKELLVDENGWKLEYDPNLGGRGVPTSTDDLNVYFNTIFDPNVIDNSPFLETYYSQDTLLQSILGQRNRKIYDVSSNIENQIYDGGSQIVIDNLRQVMISEASTFQEKSNKRKKQIELAIKMPAMYGRGNTYAPGKVPVNDFSYLEGINFLVGIDKQRQITLKQDDVEGSILPLKTKFTQQIENDSSIPLNHLLLANVPIGVTIDNPLSPIAPSLAVTEVISEDSLISLYNLLTVKTSTTSDIDFGVFNSSEKGKGYDAQVVGDVSNVLNLGLGLAYLEGVAIPSATNQETMERTGSYIKLPERKEFQDLLYSREGATFETWTHVPALDSQNYGFNIGSDVSGLYRLLLANENVGLAPNVVAQPDILNMSLDKGSSVARGLIFGFTRDRRFTQNLLPSNSEPENSTDNLCLVLAPTQSYDSSSAGFINKQDANCLSTSSWHGMVVDVWDTIGGVSLSSCGREFCQLSLTLNPNANEITMYMDGVSLATSSYQDVFGISPVKETPKIPSVLSDEAFEYGPTTVQANSADSVKAGPKLDEYFTPWILGGGYTDGNPSGNFMGGEYGGKISGLKGYMGCTKFYSRPTSPAEVLSNFEATKSFFKNIEVPNLMWEPINII